jgi:putative salt-induced outer membrane protein YdiY
MRKVVNFVPRVAILLTAVLLLISGRLHAASVQLTNGDRLTGQVEGLTAAKLALKTPYAGSVKIDWTQIKALIVDEMNVMVEVESGRRYIGRIEKENDILIIEKDDVRNEILTRDVVSLVPMTDSEPPGFWKLLEGSFDVGYSFTRGNSSQTQSSVGARGQYRTQTYKAQGQLSSIFSETDDAAPTSRHAADARLDRYVTPEMFLFGLTGFERNDRQNLDLRSKFGGGFGWELLDTKKSQFSVLGGFTYLNEQFRAVEDGEEPPRTSTGEGLLGVEWQTIPFMNVRFSTKLSVHPNLIQGGRYRVEYDSALRIPLLSSFNFSVSLFDRYDSRPPSVDVKRNDYGMISALGVTS